MISISELTGHRLKKDLGAERCIKRYHNKHVDGSGNFGFTIVKNRVWFTLDGDYGSDGAAYRLHYSTFGYTGDPFRGFAGASYEEFAKELSSYIDVKVARRVQLRLEVPA